MTNPRILVAGIGNIFLGDDAFGVEVVHRLDPQRLPDGVRVTDFGICGFDLAYALMEDYDAAILVDATARGGAPGTLYLIEVPPDGQEESLAQPAAMDAHGMNPMRVLEMVRSLGGRPKRVLVVGCEPATLEEDAEGEFGLSPAVESAADRAVGMIESLVARIRDEARAGVGEG